LHYLTHYTNKTKTVNSASQKSTHSSRDVAKFDKTIAKIIRQVTSTLFHSFNLSKSAQLGGRLHNWQSEKLTDIGTGVNYDSDMDIFREQCRKFWAGIDPKRVEKWDRDHMPDAEIWREAGEAGLLCIDTPAEYGGIGADFEYSMVACEEQSYAGPKFYGPGFGLHSGIVAPYITSFGTEEQKHKYIPSMTTGETISCIGMTEPSGGSDLQGLKIGGT
jgi:alkylation response protein AidB-like acyl-CoA dehydrogenase